MSYKLNFSYKNEKENSIKLLLLEHHLNNQNVKKKDKLSVYNSMYLKDKVDNDKVNDIIKTIFYTNSDNMLDSNGNNNFNGLIIPYNVERIRKKGIQNFYNVYQSKYNSGKANATGLGDFIRGCYFMMEFCDEHNFKYNVLFNNCISKFLKIKTPNIGLISKMLERVVFFRNNNLLEYNIQNNVILEPIKNNSNIMVDFVEYTMNTLYYDNNVFIYNNAFPRYDIKDHHKTYMTRILEPTDDIKVNVHKIMSELNLCSKQFYLIHIRAGDNYLKKESSTFKKEFISKLINNIKNDIGQIMNINSIDNGIGNEKKTIPNFLLISDNNEIKSILKCFFPNFKIFIKPITHFGEGVELEEENVKNTLIDFYIISFAKSIYAYSVYKHGSGFSYWCAKTFNINYTCKYIE
jgi:hypothetical protein